LAYAEWIACKQALDQQDIHFNQLHAACGSRIKQQHFCPVCQRDVNYDELVKGYDVSKDQYVRISQNDLDQLQASESDPMQILEFVPLSAVDPIHFESTSSLGSEKQGEKAYQLSSLRKRWRISNGSSWPSGETIVRPKLDSSKVPRIILRPCCCVGCHQDFHTTFRFT